MLSVTPDSVVGTVHAPRLAPAVGLRAKTRSFLESMMSLGPSGREFNGSFMAHHTIFEISP